MSNALTKPSWDPTVTPEVDPWDEWDETRNQAIQADNQRNSQGIDWGNVARVTAKSLGNMELSKPQVQPYQMPRTKFGGRFR